MDKTFTHFDTHGRAIMVDVGEKAITRRTARAAGKIIASGATLSAIKNGTTKKGDVLAVARIAGIMAVKKTPALIPLCHTIIIDSAGIEFEIDENNHTIKAVCTVALEGKTGAEMEALTGVTAALLTIYDMCKAIDRSMRLTDIHLAEKTGGKSGHFIFGEPETPAHEDKQP